MIPKRGRPADEILGDLEARAARDVNWRGGRVFSLVYHAGEAHEQLVQRAHASYASANLLNPIAFAGLRELERDVVAMAAALCHGAGATGTVTSGGTESILCAVAAYRDRARKWWPELVVPRTVHPAFDKAAHYFGVRLVKVDVGPDLRADVRAVARAIGRRTIGIVASAPQYPHGVVDPIAALGELAQRRGLPLHVDACLGGFVLPWLERLGRAVPRWDFRVPGVTSISADLHKFGYGAKGASVLLWRDPRDMKHQIFVATDWPGGIYASPTLLGTRPGGPIAAAWAALHALGEDGYLDLARRAADAADRLRAGIAAIPQLQPVGQGDATIVAYAARGGDTFALADRLEARGWTVDRQHRPACIHLTVTANHAAIVDDYLADLRAAAAEPGKVTGGRAAMYGMAATLPLRRLVASRVRAEVAKWYAPRPVR
ncbi:MAG TPA: aminotransferase class V-fold PLP-dependent enzyme [Kofleriaceae bacterium]|jgi:glutamate/tyrosine decarboxylase-like PLP-dependent enzyme